VFSKPLNSKIDSARDLGMAIPFQNWKRPFAALLPVAFASPYGVVDKGAPGMDAWYNCARPPQKAEQRRRALWRHP
jgi:hypothetical protein